LISVVYVMRVERIFDPEDREDFDAWLFSDLDAPKQLTPAQEAELAMARYDLGIGPAPMPAHLVGEGEVIQIGRDR
jgi:hypothetical protein